MNWGQPRNANPKKLRFVSACEAAAGTKMIKEAMSVMNDARSPRQSLTRKDNGQLELRLVFIGRKLIFFFGLYNKQVARFR